MTIINNVAVRNTSPDVAPPQCRNAALDVLRSYAIIHVVMSHAVPSFFPKIPPPIADIVWLVLSLNFGVPLFFILSGFLITRQLDQSATPSVFYLKRFSKIYPTYLLVLCVYYAMGEISEPGIPFVLGLQNWWSNSLGELGFSWSLAVEIQYYLVVPLFFLRLRSSRVLGYGVLYLLGVCLLYVLLAEQASDTTVEKNFSRAFAFYTHTFVNIPSLCLGGVLYWMRKHHRVIAGAGVWLVLGIVLLLLTRYQFSKTLYLSGVTLGSRGEQLAFAVYVVGCPIVSFLLTYWAQDRLQRAPAVFRWIARISYQWYLVHVFLLTHWPAGEGWIRFPAYLLTSFLVASILTVVIEEPMMRVIRKAGNIFLSQKHNK